MKLTRGVGDSAAGAAVSAGTIASSIGRAIDAPIPRRNVRRRIAMRVTNIGRILTGSRGSRGSVAKRYFPGGTGDSHVIASSSRALHEEQPRRLLVGRVRVDLGIVADDDVGDRGHSDCL